MPAKLPERHRKPVPVPPPTVGGMKVGGAGYVQHDAVFIDSNWEVWLDPVAPVTMEAPDNRDAPPSPFRVARRDDGYELKILRPQQLEAQPASVLPTALFPVVEVL